MITDGSDPMIPVFFVVGGLLMLILAIAFFRSKEKINKMFGLGIVLDAVAFEIWAYMSIFRPENIAAVTNIGVLIFFASFVVFAVVVLMTLQGALRVGMSILTAILLAGLLAARFFFVKSNPHFLDNGLFSFGVEPAMMYVYVVVSAFTILPAAYVVAGNVKSMATRTIMQFGFTLMVIGITVLLTTENRELQTMNGYGMIAGLFLATGGQVRASLVPAAKPVAKSKKIKK